MRRFFPKTREMSVAEFCECLAAETSFELDDLADFLFKQENWPFDLINDSNNAWPSFVPSFRSLAYSIPSEIVHMPLMFIQCQQCHVFTCDPGRCGFSGPEVQPGMQFSLSSSSSPFMSYGSCTRLRVLVRLRPSHVGTPTNRCDFSSLAVQPGMQFSI